MKNEMMFAISLAAMLFFSGCASQPQQEGGKLEVVASFYPMYDFAKNVGGERVEVSVLIPPGVEPHEFEPSPSAVRRLSGADIFVYNGAGLEPWVPNLLDGVGNPGPVSVDASTGIPLISSEDPDEPGNDPHIWLDPVLAKTQVANIRDAFIQADPEGRDYYEANAAAYMAELDALDAELRATFNSCQKKDILITHATLAYFCREYGCRQIPIEGVSEEGEPSPGDIAEIISQARERNVTVVFFESLINPQSAEMIALEINGSVASFNSVHGLTDEEAQAGDDYISLMHGNVATIKNALDCN